MAFEKAQSVQLGWFSEDTHNVRAQEVYEAIFGEEPDTTQRNKVPSASSPFFSVASGVKGDLSHAVHVLPGRIDIYLISNINPAKPYSIESDSVLLFLAQAIDKATHLLPPATRYALVSNLVEKAESTDKAAKYIFEILGINNDPKNTLDLIFQINKRSIILDEISVNRLLRYQVATFQTFAVTQAGPVPVPASDESVAVFLTIDVNTASQNILFELSAAGVVFSELARELTRIRLEASPRVLD